MDRLILDFENNTLTIETDNQQSAETYPNLNEKKEEIYKVLGYETINVSPLVEAIEGLLNGNLTKEETIKNLDKWLQE